MLKQILIILLVSGLTSPAFANQGYWFGAGGLSNCGQKAVDLLKSADEEGLEPGHYRYAVDAAERAQKGQGSYAEAAAKLTQAMKQYVDDIRNGRFDPKLADRQIVMRPSPVNPAKIVSSGMASGSCHWMTQQAPPYIEYQQLKLILRKYKVLESRGSWPKIPTNITLRPGERNEHVASLRYILGGLGDLSPSQVDGGTYFDEGVKLAVQDFQARHAMNRDGVVGTVTIQELNKTPSDRIRQIKVTMERWRWMPRNPGYRHIKVNVAGFQLDAVQGGRIVMRTPIIVGEEFYETPVFTAIMTDIKFNPSWHVPHGLATQDKLPEILKDPSYLTRNNFVVTQKIGNTYKTVDPRSINWRNYSSSNFPFQLRQLPGDNNALGKIRFTIQSPFNIYLHSTPYQYLFDYPTRNFSAGCIRVKNVVGLAEFALKSPEWTRNRITQEMQGYQTKQVNLNERIPVHVTYFTVWVDGYGVPHFMPDAYGQDQQIWQAMKHY